MYSFTNAPIRVRKLGSGRMISINTLKEMEKVIQESSRNWRVREKAAEIVSGLPWKDKMAEAQAILDYVVRNSRYLEDPEGREMIMTPWVAFDKWEKGEIWQGDCDDYTVLLLSLYKSIGIPVAMRVASYMPSGVYGHVYGLVKLKSPDYPQGKWFPVDGIKSTQGTGDAVIGWEAPNWTKMADWPIK